MIITAKRLGALAVVAVLGSSGYAFMNANTVSSSGAGSGSGPVYGYSISNISYSVAHGSIGEPGPGPGPGPGSGSGPVSGPGPCNSSTHLGQICDVSFKASPQVVGEPAAANAFVALQDSDGNILGSWVPCARTGGPDGSNNTYWNCQFSSPQALHPPTSLDVRATS